MAPNQSRRSRGKGSRPIDAPEAARQGTSDGGRRATMSATRIREALRRAALYRRTGRLADSQALYREVLAARPDHKDALKACAVVSLQLDEPRQAVALLRRAVALDDRDSGAHNDLGNALQVAGHIDGAIAAYRRAIGIDPAKAETHFNLGHALRGKGDLDGAAAAYSRAAELRPDHAGTMLQIGLVDHAKGDLDRAERAFHRAIAIDPENAEAHFALGNALYASGSLNNALRAYQRAAALKVDVLDVSFEVGKPRHVHAHFDRKDPRAALEACDAFLARRPGQSGALAMKAVALWELGEHAAARELLGFDGLIRRVRCSLPAGFADMTAFNEALAAHIRGHPTLQEAPESYSMERGKSTGELFPGRGPAIATFHKMIERAVDDYREALPRGSDHPFMADVPRQIRTTAWGVILDAGAYQVPHIHPSAWLSGVYYVHLPRAVDENDAAHAGWIEFGRPYWDFQIRAEPETRLVKPEEGLMLLFPSYTFHRTLPFKGDEERISIAFDVLRPE